MKSKQKKDMFVHTQNRLTVQYSVLMMIFLTLFVTIVYALVKTMITAEQERQLHSMTSQMASVIRDSLRDERMSRRELDNLHTIQENEDRSFYYVVNPSGQILFGNAFLPRLESKIVALVEGWIPDRREIRHETMMLPPPPKQKNDLRPPPRQIHLVMTGQEIYHRDQLIGILYTGRDITFAFELTNRLLAILSILGILFLGVALLLSYFMSKRAMIPIRHSFTRQREFVADASHELRTPLSILYSSLDVFEMEEEDRLSDFSRHVLSDMKDEVRSMTRLVGDLLTLARSDTGYPDLTYESFDCIPSMEQMIRSTQPLAHAKNMTLKLDAPPRLMIHGDHERIKQLLYILLDNALKYTPDGGDIQVTLTVESPEQKPYLCIVVQDTGVGIPLEEQGQIFERFYRVDKNRSRQMGGTGLGLSIAKWIVEAHYGTLQVSSVVGQGSTFTAMIPLAFPKT